MENDLNLTSFVLTGIRLYYLKQRKKHILTYVWIAMILDAMSACN